jgi:hypothetical protein
MGKHNGLKQESLNNSPMSSFWAKETQPIHDKTTDAYTFPLTGTIGRKTTDAYTFPLKGTIGRKRII